MRTRFLMTTAASIFALSVAGGAAAQQEQGQSDVMDEQLREKIELSSWDYQALYESGWRANELIGSTVVGGGGEEIGEVSNIIVGADDTAEAIVVEAGGFLDMGVTYLRVPWDQVEWSPDAQQVQVPVQAENVAQFSLFGDDPEVGREAWRVTNLVGDYVSLQDRPGYGVVNDVVFGQDGSIQAILVQPDVAQEDQAPVALPYDGGQMRGDDFGDEPGVGMRSATRPGDDWYDAPYSYGEVGELEAFDQEQMQR